MHDPVHGPEPEDAGSRRGRLLLAAGLGAALVLAVVLVAVLVLRKDRVDADHFRTPTFLPVVGALACGFLATPWAGRPAEQYRVAGVLLAIGVVLWGVTVLVNRRTGAGTPRFDPDSLAGDRPSGPRN